MAGKDKDLMAVIFETQDGARQALEGMTDLEQGAYVHIEDTAVVVMDENGKIDEDNTVSRGTKMTTGIAGSAGFLAGLLLGGPIGGLAVGLLGGALAGNLGHMGIDPDFVKGVEAQLKPGNSALFVLSRADSRDMVIASLAPFEGTLVATTLPPEAEAQLREYLK
jgi:uncharacterized membrane protein